MVKVQGVTDELAEREPAASGMAHLEAIWEEADVGGRNFVGERLADIHRVEVRRHPEPKSCLTRLRAVDRAQPEAEAVLEQARRVEISNSMNIACITLLA